MQVQLEGEDEPVQVSPEQVELEDGDPFVDQDEVDGIVQSRLNRERRKALDNMGLNPSDYRDDNGNIDLDAVEEGDVFQTLAQQRGIELREDGKPKGSVTDEELQELRKKASRVDDLESQVNEYESQIEDTRETRLESKVLTTADGIQDGAQDDVLANAKRQMTYDDEYGWVATDDEGNVKFEGGEPVGAETVVENIRDNKPYLFKDTEVSSGPGTQPDGSGGNGRKTWTRDEWEQAANRTHEMDDETFEDWDTAEEEGRIQD